MGKPNGKRMKLSEMRAQRAKALGGRYVELEGEDGSVVQVPYMAFWSAEMYEAFVAESGFRTDMATLEHIMSAEEFAKLKALELELGDVADLIAEVSKDVKRPESQGSSTP